MAKPPKSQSSPAPAPSGDGAAEAGVESVRLPTRRCPICEKPTDPRYRPFCSKRCADIDLGKWLTESYRVPSQDGPEDEEYDER
ncbi:MAG: DNA gyrase inhibitor YacG [Rhodospirillaceae bacterium]